MEPFLYTLEHAFPRQNCALLVGILLFPLIGALVNGLFGRRIGRQGVTLMALSAVAAALVASAAAAALLFVRSGAGGAALVYQGWSWLTLPLRPEGALELRFSLLLDPLSAVMALVVTGVGLLIHVYSVGYMAKDPGYERFFAYLNLFIFSMLLLVLGGSLPVMFVGWEGVGLCSYLLIGFWYEEEKNAAAAKKAFIANRIGDAGLIMAMAILLYYVGRLDWTGIASGRENLHELVRMWPIWPVGMHLPGPLAAVGWLNASHHVTAATLVGLLIFLGCAGKSAQIPLYVWLPDAMAGPTPVSALIHAATMVTAGVYLVCRMAPVFVMSPAAMFIIATVGVLTALLAATIALVQNDIKKVLAYSTVSQLGYMFLAVGVGAFSAGLFHLVTHAFFKACLFLGAGSVIHALHSRIHDSDAAQDVRNMGGLRRYLPHTHWTFLASCLAIAGCPLTSGFFSKEQILTEAFTSRFQAPGGASPDSVGEVVAGVFRWPEWAPTALYVGALVGAVLTAFYMFRLYFLVFWGGFRGWEIGRRRKGEPRRSEAPAPAESPRVMTVPLMVLGAGALGVGFLNARPSTFVPLEQFVSPVFATARRAIGQVAGAEEYEMPLLALGIAAALLGMGAAYWVYVMQRGEPAREAVARVPRLHQAAQNRWYVDELYEETLLGAVDVLAGWSVWFDKWVVDGLIAGFSSFSVKVAGMGLRLLQTGRVQAYAAAFVLGLGGSAWYLLRPHAAAVAFQDHLSGRYRVSASPGFGYQYRWDQDGDGKWDSLTFGDQASVEVTLERNQARTVRMQVRNAFGFTAERSFALARPKEDRSKPVRLNVQEGPDGQPRAVVPGVAGDAREPLGPDHPSPSGRAPVRRDGEGVE
jgi:NADH-quinone oxidoreductase subunit L